jgi:hypothetical protein
MILNIRELNQKHFVMFGSYISPGFDLQYRRKKIIKRRQGRRPSGTLTLEEDFDKISRGRHILVTLKCSGALSVLITRLHQPPQLIYAASGTADCATGRRPGYHL